MTMSHEDYVARAVQSRAEITGPVLWTMLKSHLYLAAGFVGASVAAIALRALLAADNTQLSPPELLLATAAGAALTAFAWLRALRVLEPAGEVAESPVVTTDHVRSALRGFSQG